MKKSIIIIIAITASFCGFAQTDTLKSSVVKTTFTSQKYTCPMHPGVISSKPGKCPECGMDLKKAKVYSCPMHPEVVSYDPGKCPKCGMDLKLVKHKSNMKG